MSNIIIIIQARMTSERLPGKVLLPIGDKPVLQLLIERLPDWRDNIVVATTNDGSETPIIQLCERLGVATFKGPTEDVLGRYYQTAKAFGAQPGDGIIRLTSDCPLVDNELTSRVINTFKNNDVDMVSVGPHCGYPRGLDCVLFRFDLLEKTYLNTSDPLDREHVTRSMGKFSDRPCLHLHAKKDLSFHRLTLDERDDYKAIKEVFKLFNYRTDFSYPRLVQILEQNPYLHEINKHVQQKAS